MKDIALFTDVSVNPRLKLGVGAYLVMPASFLASPSCFIDGSDIGEQIQLRRFEDTSSTKLELQTLLWAIQEQQISSTRRLRIYCDSRCVTGLLKRRAGLLAKDYLSGRTERPLRNAPLYRAFYELHDALGFEVIKVEGHARARAHDTVRDIFSRVDKKARKALRLWMDESAEAAASADKVNNENWCVYVLRCRNNSLYTGMTNNIERRLEEHEQGRGSKFVRSWRPFELVKTIPCKDAGEARRLEYEMKKLSRREKIAALELLTEPMP